MSWRGLKKRLVKFKVSVNGCEYNFAIGVKMFTEKLISLVFSYSALISVFQSIRKVLFHSA